MKAFCPFLLLEAHLMSHEVVVLKTFNNEVEAGMAQQVLQEAGMTSFISKDDAGGRAPATANSRRSFSR